MTATLSAALTLWSVFSIIAAHFPAFICCAVECLHHLACILLWHFYVAELVEQVDVSHLLAAFHIFVKILHNLAWIETVGLAKVDKQFSVTLLWFARTLFLAFGLLFLAILFLLYRRQLWGIGVISDETTELASHDFLYHVFLVEILEVAVYLSHERCYLLLVDVHLYNLVHHLIKLLGADFLWRWYHACHKLLADGFLHLAYLVLLTSVNDGD